eukprot:TRINITY_DN11780_c0_g1_i1.p1 TRINITY_DN11780_c0_g1~~TRINITY_DN11780_c0_g1_i1.p1  ORF type:complete len:374 (+),score=76.28 TRINITY_DN11780_c0_g1_i1:55-1176(+)
MISAVVHRSSLISRLARSSSAASSLFSPSPTPSISPLFPLRVAMPITSFLRSYFVPTSPVLLEDAEKKMLRNVKTPYESRLVAIGNGDYINTLICGDPKNPPLVLAHGFGTGVGLWYPNLDDLATKFRVYAFDWIGYGRSSRPPFTATNSHEAEDFFLDAFEKWRKVMDLDRFILAGHSLGGYLSGCYTLKKPQHVDRLIMVSPVGIPPLPHDFEQRQQNLPFLWKAFRQLWDWNYTPQGIIRGFGPAGPGLVRKYVDARFAHVLDEEARNILINYLYHTGAQTASGEYALNTILMPGAYARNPLHDRFQGVTVPTMFLYGSHDWMDKRAGKALSSQLSVESEVYIVEEAGHHLYLDNPPAFIEAFFRAAGVL